MTTDNRTNEPTPNPTAETVIARVVAEVHAEYGNIPIPGGISQRIADRLRAHGLLSEGAPSEARVIPVATSPEHVKSGADSLHVLDPVKVAEVLCEKGYRSPDGSPYCSECLYQARALCEAYTEGRLT